MSSPPTPREREIAAAVGLGTGNWTERIAQVLADYREELAVKAKDPGVFGVKCAGCGHAWSHHVRLLHGNVCMGERRECTCQWFIAHSIAERIGE